MAARKSSGRIGVRVFNGERLFLKSIQTTKASAQAVAKIIRNKVKNNRVRVVPVKVSGATMYAVYAR